MLFVVSIPLILIGCAEQKNDQNYVVARYNWMISKSEDTICWVTNTNMNFYIEHDGQIKSKWDYHINIAPYYNNPFLSGDYLYYVGGIWDDFTQDIYIARIDYTKEEPKFEQLTENYTDIFFILSAVIRFSLYRPEMENSICI